MHITEMEFVGTGWPKRGKFLQSWQKEFRPVIYEGFLGQLNN
jgi:hypothetical protein